MKAKLLTTTVFFLVGMALSFIPKNSQAQNIKYTIVADDPDYKNLFIGLNAFDAISYDPNTGLGFNVFANALVGSKLQLDIDYKKGYSDDNAGGVFAPEGLKKYWALQLGGAYNLSTSYKIRKAKVVLNSQTTGNYVHTKYIMVPGKFKRIWAIHGGIQNFYNNCQVDNDIMKVRGENDIQYKDANGNLKFVFDNVNFETVNYTMNTFGIYAGIDFKSIVNLRVQPDGYQLKGNRKLMNFYADALFTPSVSYHLKPNAKQGFMDGYDINISDNKRSILGWRFGWKAELGKAAGFSFKAEVGQQPGRPDEKFFVSAGLGLHIGAKLKGL